MARNTYFYGDSPASRHAGRLKRKAFVRALISSPKFLKLSWRKYKSYGRHYFTNFYKFIKFKVATLFVIFACLFGEIEALPKENEILSWSNSISIEKVHAIIGMSRGGDHSKIGPGARARADAQRMGKRAKGSGSSRIPGADGFVPQNTYCQYHKYESPSCKIPAKLSDNQFQPKDDGNDMSDQDGTGKFDPSDYKGGSRPFVGKFDYDNPNYTQQNVDFSNQRRMRHSYDGHAEQCFGMTENRNKPSLQRFQGKIENFIQSPDIIKINGSYRYETPAYHYMKPDQDLVVTVNATNNEYISVRNGTDFQLEKLAIDGNLGYDSRPSMSLTLKLRGPKQ